MKNPIVVKLRKAIGELEMIQNEFEIAKESTLFDEMADCIEKLTDILGEISQ